ncbi:DUF1464 family protein [Methanonatronarchaeum sp. AMET-Sl]|uniref:DUF1464 family protein n=1 Tax=Methanonatronarchaeum sp. AMET-Sl TaxID=3037654 RepID=UPI00244E1A5C|nr:DUF1464 family protein [Methanonatronarchaeum sp. AMET-Sl]WGI17689.1 DUF1464 family protein [Methanonatronarchaeum sp. AMET-Sl]
MKALGIDPGTKSMDICGLQNGEVYYEKSIDTKKAAENPATILNPIKEAQPDIVAAPSGYGVEPTKLKNIPKNKLENWYYNYILLTEKMYIDRARKNNVFGAELYHAMTESIKQMQKLKTKVQFIPGVINLQTVPEHRKINKIDMGTADKLAVTALGIHDLHKNQEIGYGEVDLLVLEMGFGYNSIIKVENGEIVDGLGGTTMPGPGFLTASTLDLEVVQLGKVWDKQDVFQGGAQTIADVKTPQQLIETQHKPKSKLAFNAMIEAIEKGIKSLRTQKTTPILLSGRLKNIPKIKQTIKQKLHTHPIRNMKTLKNATKTKETAQGYAMVADGLNKGKNKNLINHMKIPKAKGHCLDYLYHPKVEKIPETYTQFKPKK